VTGFPEFPNSRLVANGNHICHNSLTPRHKSHVIAENTLEAQDNSQQGDIVFDETTPEKHWTRYMHFIQLWTVQSVIIS
jgi:hypothetical protein